MKTTNWWITSHNIIHRQTLTDWSTELQRRQMSRQTNALCKTGGQLWPADILDLCAYLEHQSEDKHYTFSLTVVSFLPHYAFKIDTGTRLAWPQALRVSSQGNIGSVHRHRTCAHHYLLARRGNLTAAYCGQEVDGWRGWCRYWRFHLRRQKRGLREKHTLEPLDKPTLSIARIQPKDAEIRGCHPDLPGALESILISEEVKK